MSWGHDEYLYRVLVHNRSTLPKEGLYMIRFHSFYPWHTGGDYSNLASEEDEQMLRWVREFNKYDLYTKSSKLVLEKFPQEKSIFRKSNSKIFFFPQDPRRGGPEALLPGPDRQVLPGATGVLI